MSQPMGSDMMPEEEIAEAPDGSMLAQQVREVLDEGNPAELPDLLADTATPDIVDAYYELTHVDQLALMRLIPVEQAAEVLMELDSAVQYALLQEMEPQNLAAIINCMEPDDAADIVGQMDKAAAEALLAKLDPEVRATVTVLLAYDEDTAGGIMDPDVVQVRVHQTVASAIARIREYVHRVDLDDFFSIFVVDEDDRLVGVVPAWKMLLAEPGQLVSEIMIEDVVSVEANTDQEEVARLVRDYDLVTVPVVDKQRLLLGRITVDDVVDVIQEEHHEDYVRLSGTGGDTVREYSILQTLRVRTPWLFVALVGEFANAIIMQQNENVLTLIPQLAFFIPLIMAMAGNTGIQSSSLVIRGLATGEVRLSHFWRRLGREVLISFCVGVLFALVLIGAGGVLTGEFKIGLSVGLATLAAIFQAAAVGTSIPMILHRFGVDPALATGPFLTTMNDILGMLLYLLIAWYIIF